MQWAGDMGAWRRVAGLLAPALMGWCALILPSLVNASSPQSLGSFHHTAFQVAEGAPADIGALAQTRDGFLWIAGTKGLTRFDGVRFEPFVPFAGEALIEAQVENIFPAEDGGLWIANSSAAPTLLKDGHLRHFGEQDGYRGTRSGFFADKDGHVWAASSAGLLRFLGGKWELVYPAEGSFKPFGGRFDSSGGLWATSSGGLLSYLAPGDRALRPVDLGGQLAKRLWAGVSGRLYVKNADALRVYRNVGGSLREVTGALPLLPLAVTESRDGSLWVATAKGLVYISPSEMAQAEARGTVPSLEVVTRQDGMSGTYAWPIIEDRELDLWVGTQTGLDRFRRTLFTAVALPDAIHELSAAVDRTGGIWVGSESHPVLRSVPPAGWTATSIPPFTLATTTDPTTGEAWLASDKGVWRLHDGEVDQVAADLPVTGFGLVMCIVRTPSDATYICARHDGASLFRLDGKRWVPALRTNGAVKVAVSDAAGALWAGLATSNALVVIRGAATRTFGPAEGLDVGTVKAILPDGDRVWVGGDQGVQWLESGRFHTLHPAPEDAFDTVTGLALDATGGLWVQTLDGIVQVAAADVRHALAGRAAPVAVSRLGVADGVPGAPDPDRTLPSLRTADDGRIWTHTTTGLAWVDPADARPSAVIPDVIISAVQVGAATRSIEKGRLTLDAGDRAFRIAYTSPFLSRPEQLHFAYRLVGLSDAWQSVGTRREAVFTNIPPGAYRFEVKALNVDGRTESAVAKITLERKPAFVETWWFRSLALVPLAALVWLVVSLRTRTLARRMKIRAEERESVARDIHDTLLQRFQALMLNLETWSAGNEAPPSLKAKIAVASGHARDAVSEARDRILSLRSSGDAGLGFYDQLLSEGKALAESGGMTFHFDVLGSARELAPNCQHELHDVVLEALRNSATHGGGTRIGLTLSYEDAAFWVVIADDGRGFDPATATDRAGHFGLVGMRERIARLRGHVRFDSAPGEGTEVHVHVPGVVAYQKARSGR